MFGGLATEFARSVFPPVCSNTDRSKMRNRFANNGRTRISRRIAPDALATKPNLAIRFCRAAAVSPHCVKGSAPVPSKGSSLPSLPMRRSQQARWCRDHLYLPIGLRTLRAPRSALADHRMAMHSAGIQVALSASLAEASKPMRLAGPMSRSTNH